MSFHKYAYANMNPVMYTDPSGRFISLIMTTLSQAYLRVMPAVTMVTKIFPFVTNTIVMAVAGLQLIPFSNNMNDMARLLDMMPDNRMPKMQSMVCAIQARNVALHADSILRSNGLKAGVIIGLNIAFFKKAAIRTTLNAGNMLIAYINLLDMYDSLDGFIGTVSMFSDILGLPVNASMAPGSRYINSLKIAVKFLTFQINLPKWSDMLKQSVFEKNAGNDEASMEILKDLFADMKQGLSGFININ